MVSLLFQRPSSPDLRDPQSGLFLTFYAIVFVSGFRRYAEDLEMMLGKKQTSGSGSAGWLLLRLYFS